MADFGIPGFRDPSDFQGFRGFGPFLDHFWTSSGRPRDGVCAGEHVYHVISPLNAPWDCAHVLLVHAR